jgi:alkylated DNA repair dioxygenase AlkB
MTIAQLSLFETAPELPEGFAYRAQLMSAEEEQALVDHFRQLPFKEFEFQGYRGNRRVVSFGMRYDFNGGGLTKADNIPSFLMPLRGQAAAFAGLEPDALAHVLVTEYAPGAGIGWHRDRPEFGDVVGISLVSPCTFRLRLKEGKGWRRASLTAEPRSAYLMRGPARTLWEHSIPPMESLRYSVTFRSLRSGSADEYL